MGNSNTRGWGKKTTAHTPRDTKKKTKVYMKCTLEIHEINILSFLGCYQRCKIICSEKPEYNAVSLLPAIPVWGWG